jgi:hypothetical protein
MKVVVTNSIASCAATDGGIHVSVVVWLALLHPEVINEFFSRVVLI